MRVSSNSTFTDEQAKVFASETRRLRKDAGLTPKQFAELVGVSQSYVTNIESGHRKPSPQLASRIAELFDTSVSGMLRLVAEEPSEDRKKYGRELFEGRMNKGYPRSLVAGALGVPVEVYVEYERGECSITERQKEILKQLLDIGKEPEAPAVVEVVADVPVDICDIIIGHVKDLKVDDDTQKKVWRYFTGIKIDAEERRLFGKTGAL